MTTVVKENLRETVKCFLQQKTLAVIATISEDGKPHSAAVNYIIDDNFNFFFLTKKTSKKHLNIRDHADVSLTVFEGQVFPASAQIDGVASVVDDDEEKTRIQKALIEKLWNGPYLPPILKQPGWGTALVKVSVRKIKWFVLPSESEIVKFEFLEFA